MSADGGSAAVADQPLPGLGDRASNLGRLLAVLQDAGQAAAACRHHAGPSGPLVWLCVGWQSLRPVLTVSAQTRGDLMRAVVRAAVAVAAVGVGAATGVAAAKGGDIGGTQGLGKVVT
jgi:hypothetical protein